MGVFSGAENGQRRDGIRVKEYKGKVRTIIIPDSAALVKRTMGKNGGSESEISLNELRTDRTLSIYYNSD